MSLQRHTNLPGLTLHQNYLAVPVHYVRQAKQRIGYLVHCMPMHNSVLVMQALTLWLQYTSLLGQINLPTPTTLHWVFSTCSFAFSSLTSGSLSTDCLLSLEPTNLAFKRLLLQLAVPPIVLVLLLTVQLCW